MGKDQFLQILAVTCLHAGLSRGFQAVGHSSKDNKSNMGSEVPSFVPCYQLPRNGILGQQKVYVELLNQLLNDFPVSNFSVLLEMFKS